MSAVRHHLSLTKLRTAVAQYDAGHLKICEHLLYVMLGDFKGTPEAHRVWALMALAMTMARLGYDGSHISGLWHEGKEAYRKLCEHYHIGQDEAHDRDMERLRLLVVNAEPMLADMGLVLEPNQLCLNMRSLNISSNVSGETAVEKETSIASGGTRDNTGGCDDNHNRNILEMDSSE